MKWKKGFSIILVAIAVIAIGVYFVVPTIALNIIKSNITQNPANSVESINISWNGPQTLTGLHLEDEFGKADVDVVISNSLFGFLSSNWLISIDIQGDATIYTSNSIDSPDSSTATEPQGDVSSEISIPRLSLTTKLNSLIIDGDEPIEFNDIQCDFQIDPGRACSGTLVATTDRGGSIDCVLNAPDLLTPQGDINWDSSATCSISISDATIPTINGQGGWSIVELTGDISSPKLADAINVSISGSLAEYDIPNGTINIKTQLLSTSSQNAYVFNNREIVGTVDIVDVPTTLLAPLVHSYNINPTRDLGNTMELHMNRAYEGQTLFVTFGSEKVVASGDVDSAHGTITNIDIAAELHDELIQSMTNGEFSGDATATIHFDRLVPIGFSYDEDEECIGSVKFVGDIQHDSTNTTIPSFQSYFVVDLSDRRINANGSAILDEQETSFGFTQFSTNDDQLHGIANLYTTIIQQFPKGGGVVNVDNLPMRVLMSITPQEQRSLLNLFGSTISATVASVDSGLHVEAFSDTGEAIGTVQLLENEFDSIQDARVQLKLNKDVTSRLFGIPFRSESLLKATINSIDRNGNASFDATFDVGKQHTFIQGKTTRILDGDRTGQLDAHLAATGIDAQLLDAMWVGNGLLSDSLGSPIAAEFIATNILQEPTIVAGGNSPNAAFETSIKITDNTIATVQDVITMGSLQLSSALTQHLLKDLGPILSDIRSVEHPIQMQVANASTSLDSDVSTLNADIYIDIGEVALDSGSITMKLLPMFNTKHVEVIPAFFDPIQIEIRNGIATYKTFSLTLANKYSIPYSGSINFVTRELNLRSAVPLTGLGYSIKEIRGLATDIDVPVLITGTIDHPVTKVDPQFDLGKLLQSAAITAIGDAIGGVDNVPNPLDLLEELLGGN